MKLYGYRISTLAAVLLAPLALIVAATTNAEDIDTENTNATPGKGATTIDSSRLRPVASFDDTGPEQDRSVAFFTEAGKVITHPRCVNCHPAGDQPLQGETGQLHQPMVVRGDHGFGAVGMRCTTCHGDENFDPGRVPGNSHWLLAPIEMVWEGKTLGDICRQIKDPERNGGRSLEEIVRHMEEDPLVGWAWAPGAGRRPAPGTQSAFADLIRAWAETGAACPSL